MAKRRGNKINVFLHYVWATHERLPLLTGEMERAVYRYIEKVCQDNTFRTRNSIMRVTRCCANWKKPTKNTTLANLNVDCIL